MVDGKRLHVVNDSDLARFLKAAALCTDAYVNQEGEDGAWSVVGDTTEGALLVAARKAGWSREQLEDDLPRVAELPFSSECKAMTTVHELRGPFAADLFADVPYVAFIKGAPDGLVGWAVHEQSPAGPVPLTLSVAKPAGQDQCDGCRRAARDGVSRTATWRSA
jgi:Ca2+-transporting ATPase